MNAKISARTKLIIACIVLGLILAMMWALYYNSKQDYIISKPLLADVFTHFNRTNSVTNVNYVRTCSGPNLVIPGISACQGEYYVAYRSSGDSCADADQVAKSLTDSGYTVSISQLNLVYGTPISDCRNTSVGFTTTESGQTPIYVTCEFDASDPTIRQRILQPKDFPGQTLPKDIFFCTATTIAGNWPRSTFF